MGLYTKQSIETLRQRIDLVDLLMAHVELKRSGGAYKGLCPFHEEKTPSFIVQKGDTHYHCFGCGAHGDAIAFLMSHLKMGFVEAVESLAERFQVALEKIEAPEAEKGPNKALLKHALEEAAYLYHYLLLHSTEGHQALHYLYERGINLAFIRQFQLGYAPKDDVLYSYLHSRAVTEDVMEQAGLIRNKKRDFFNQRILFPIRDGLGAVIGFSGRKFKEETFGGKYINTPETPLFKKSHVLFGLSYSRAKIAKERSAIIVEGQIDALRLIHLGFDKTVAGQGTAFGQEHARALIHLGVNKVYLALDADDAGREATVKIGNLFLQKGIDVLIVPIPEASDPDSLLLAKGPAFFSSLLESSQDYLTFLFYHLSRGEKELSPSKKSEIVKTIAQMIRSWEEPVMIHESLKKLSLIAQIPESALGLQQQIPIPQLYIRRGEKVQFDQINPDRILEADLLRWMCLAGSQLPQIVALCKANIRQEHFRLAEAGRLFNACLCVYEEKGVCDLLALGSLVSSEEEQLLLSEIMQRKVNMQKAEEGCRETIKKILLRNWMEQRENIRIKIHSTFLSEEEALELAKQFDLLKSQIPEVVTPPA